MKPSPVLSSAMAALLEIFLLHGCVEFQERHAALGEAPLKLCAAVFRVRRVAELPEGFVPVEQNAPVRTAVDNVLRHHFRRGQLVTGCLLRGEGLFVVDVAPRLPTNLLTVGRAVEVGDRLCAVLTGKRARPERTLGAVVAHYHSSSLSSSSSGASSSSISSVRFERSSLTRSPV